MVRIDYFTPTRDGGLRSKTMTTKQGRELYVVVYKDEMRFKIISECNRTILVHKTCKTLPSMRQMVRRELTKLGVFLEKIYMPKERKEKVIKNLKRNFTKRNKGDNIN